MNTKELLLYNSLQGLYLLNKTNKETVLHNLLGIQSQFAGYAQTSLFLRCNDYHEDNYGDQVSKIWSHRGTMHIVNDYDIPLHLAAADSMGRSWDGYLGILESDCDKWSKFIVEEVKNGNTSRNGLKKACLQEGMSEDLQKIIFHGWGGLIREMVFRGMIVGTTGNQKEYKLPDFSKEIRYSRDEARLEMMRIYFEHFGPATISDCRYFFGSWKYSEIRDLLDQVTQEMMKTEIDGTVYYHKNPLITEFEMPECVFVPGFDQLVLGYRDRSRMIDDIHLKKLTNVAGIIRPSLIIRNRIRAQWKYENDTLIISPFERILKKDIVLIKKTAKKIWEKKIEVLLCEYGYCNREE